MKKTACQLVYQFCKENGICTLCQVRFAIVDNNKCERCIEGSKKAQARQRVKYLSVGNAKKTMDFSG